MLNRLRGYWITASEPRLLLKRAWDRFRVAMHNLSGGMLFPWQGYLFLMRGPELQRPLGMTTTEERAFLAWWMKERYRGEGTVVELGPFVGASTVSICHGLRLNNRVRKNCERVRVYDRFICDDFMAQSINSALGSPRLAGASSAPLQAGDSSLPAFLRQTAEYESLIDLRPGDLLSQKHDGAPVELLFVDAMKTPELAEHVVREFFSCLLPGKSLLIQQDFVHYWTSWIHLIQYDLRDRCEFACHVPRSDSAVFTVRKSIVDAAAYKLNIQTRSDAEIDEVFAYSLRLIDGDMRENVHAAKAMHYYHAGQVDRCREMVGRYLRDNPAAKNDMRIVADLLNAETDRAGLQIG